MPTPFAQYEICPLPALKARFSSMQVPLQRFTKNVGELDNMILNIRDNVAKAIMLQDLQIEFQNRYPNTVAQIVQYGEYIRDQRIQRARKQFAASGVNSITPPVGYFQVYYPDYDGDFNQFTSVYGVPRIVYFYGTPTNGTTGTYAGLADNGSFLIDSQHQIVYQQRGSLLSPTWGTWDTSQLADFLLNPDVLQIWAGSLTVQCCLEDSTMRDEISQDRYDMLDKMLARAYNIVSRDKARALQLIRPDTSLNGVISEFDASAFRDTDFFEG